MKKILLLCVCVCLAASALADGKVADLIAQMKGVNPDNLSDRQRLEKSDALTDVWKQLVAAGAPAAKEIEKELEANPADAYFQLSASMALYQIRHEAAHTQIIRALQRTSIGDNAFQYFYLCHRIARAKDPAILPVLRRLLANDKIVVVIDKDSPLIEPRAICTYLYGVYGPQAVGALKDACSDENATVRANAASVIGYFGDEKPLFVLVDMLARDTDDGVRAAAANALGQMDHLAVVPRLSQALAADTSENVRAACAFALGELRHEECIDPLALAINDTSTQVRQHAISSLEYIGKERCSEIVANRLAVEDDPAVRLSLIKALGLLGHAKSIPALKAVTEKRSADEAKQAAQAMHRIDSIGPASREPFPALEGKKVSASELNKLLKSLCDRYGDGIEQAQKTIYLSAGKDDLPKLDNLRCHVLWVVNNDSIDRLGKISKMIRLVKRKTRDMI